MKDYSQGNKLVRIERHPNPEIITAHTNFNLLAHPGIQVAVDAVQGVENMGVSSQRYRMSLYVGQAFDPNKVGQDVADALLRFVAE